MDEQDKDACATCNLAEKPLVCLFCPHRKVSRDAPIDKAVASPPHVVCEDLNHGNR